MGEPKARRSKEGARPRRERSQAGGKWGWWRRLSTSWKVAIVVLTLYGGLTGTATLLQLGHPVTARPKRDVDKQPFAVPMQVSNDGALTVKNVKTHCFVASAVDSSNNHLSDNTEHNDEWDASELEHGRHKEFFCQILIPNGSFVQGEIAVIVDYGVAFVPFKRFRHIGRFRGGIVQGKWDWNEQDLTPEFEKLVDARVPR